MCACIYVCMYVCHITGKSFAPTKTHANTFAYKVRVRVENLISGLLMLAHIDFRRHKLKAYLCAHTYKHTLYYFRYTYNWYIQYNI